MNKRTIAFCCFVWAVAILSASPANARVFSPILLPAGNNNATVAGTFQFSDASVCEGGMQVALSSA